MVTWFLRRLSWPKATKVPVVNASEEKKRPGIPMTQKILLLHAPKQPYTLTEDYPVPTIHDNEVLVRTLAIGLNPIDWKAPDFNFAIPELPYISGRELAGEVVKVPTNSRFKPGDRVIAISTDYRDLRKATYQQYVAAFDYNVVRIPPSLSAEEASTVGVAFVAAALALGICTGLDFSSVLDGPNLLSVVRACPESLAQDVKTECLHGYQELDCAKPGDWLAIWGGSSTSANLTIQLAHLLGLKVAVIVDKARHGLRLSNHDVLKPDLLVDSHDQERATTIIRANLGGRLRFALDTSGRDTAARLLDVISPCKLVDNGVEHILPAHLVGLTGLPKQTAASHTTLHSVPIKVFHEVPQVGYALVTWLERLLAGGLIKPPDVVDVEHGLEAVNRGLDRMRRGEIRGGKLVVRLETEN